MKLVQTTIIAGLSFFLSTGISFAAELDDIDLTIRVIETDSVEEMHNELSLPDVASDKAREHAESEDGHGLTQANAAREAEHQNDSEHGTEDGVRNEEYEERSINGDERDEDRQDRDAEQHEVHEDTDHEKEHDGELNTEPTPTDG